MKNLFTLFVLLVITSINFGLNFQIKSNNLNSSSELRGLETAYYPEMIESLRDNLTSPATQRLGKFVPITGNLEQMKYFFEKLKNSNKHKVRIAHYGDSLIFGDIITEYLREKFQVKYGGSGVGYVASIFDDNRMRSSIRHSFSDDWKYFSFLTRNPDRMPFGINGTVAIPQPGSWIVYECSSHLKTGSSYNFFRLFYSNADETSKIQYSVDNGKPVVVNLVAGSDVKEFSQSLSKAAKKLEIKFISGKAPYFFGSSLENGEGVYVDNYAMRGNTGMSLLDIPFDVMKDYHKYLDYDLVIINYGANVTSPTKGVYVVYENKMVQVINQFKKAFPNTSILVVSVADKTMKKGSEFVTNPEVNAILEAQKRIAQKAGVAFWNLWEAMGGANSMNSWVNSSPPYALRDFAHFNNQGGNIVAQLLFDALIDAAEKSK